MRIKRCIILQLFFLLFLRYAAAAEITGKEIKSFTILEYNRSFGFIGGMSAIGGFELDNILHFKCGFSVETAKNSAFVDIFNNVTYSPFKKFPLHFSLSHIYNGIPEYQAHSNSILQYFSFLSRHAGISFGMNMRFSSFYGSKAQFESMFSYYGYFNFINNEKILIGTGWGNFDDFYANNFGSFSYSIYSAVHINKNWVINNEIIYRQSGADGFASSFYGVNWRTGAGFSW